MSVVVICRCGTRFVLSGEFPRPVKCHNCGSRAVVAGPTDLSTGEGWRLDNHEEPPNARGTVLVAAGAACAVCSQTACGACNLCGGFYCGNHGRSRSLGGATCVRCYDGRRPLMIGGGIVAISAGIFVLRLPFTFSEAVRNHPSFGSEFILFHVAGAAMLFFVAAWSLWAAFRDFP
jgi:hypothetical protein